MSSDLVIVYHRQPYEEVTVNGKTEFRENKSPNGIVPTLKSFFGGVAHGAWVAWKLADDLENPGFEERIEIEDDYGKYSVSRLPLSAEQVREFYHVTEFLTWSHVSRVTCHDNVSIDALRVTYTRA